MPTIDEDGEVSIANHFGEGKAFPGGPVCEFKGKKIPTLVQWSEHGGITGSVKVELADDAMAMSAMQLLVGAAAAIVLSGDYFL